MLGHGQVLFNEQGVSSVNITPDSLPEWEGLSPLDSVAVT